MRPGRPPLPRLDWLSRGRQRPARAGFFGVGPIARYIHTFLAATGWSFGEIGVYDLSAEHAAAFRGYLEQAGAAGRITFHDGAEQLIRSSDLVVFATVAGQPVVFSPFGLGVLDLAVGKYVYDQVRRCGELHVIDGFFHELRRYG